MKHFTALFIALDQTNKTADKVSAIERYFRDAPPADAAWGLHFLAGGRLRGTVNTRAMRDAAMAASGVPEWLLDECYDAAGDLSETIALLLPGGHLQSTDEPLHEFVPRRILPLIGADPRQARDMLLDAWRGMDQVQRFIFNKLIRGNFRLGVQRALVLRGLAAATGIDPQILAHRISGGFDPTPDSFRRLSRPGHEADPSRPYPFCLAHQLDLPPHELGDVRDWQIEHKWDGIRAQILRREGLDRGVAIWSRGEEPIDHQFPEIAAAARALPPGSALDGEILAWRFDPASKGGGRPLSFNALQRRLNRKHTQPTLFDAEGVVFAAFDILEHQGRDIRDLPLHARRAILESILAGADTDRPVIRVPPTLACGSWADVAAARAAARETTNAEGLMLKHLASRYHPGRVAGGTAASITHDGSAESAGWWKWKVDPYSVDAVLIYAQQGSGKRAGLFTDYTFGVWDPDPSGDLVAFAKAYSGLDDEEIRRVDAFIRKNTLDRKGPVRLVKPDLVFELAFESIRESPRHKAGVAVRFPRIARWRTDKSAADADTLSHVRSLMRDADAPGARSAPQ